MGFANQLQTSSVTEVLGMSARGRYAFSLPGRVLINQQPNADLGAPPNVRYRG